MTELTLHTHHSILRITIDHLHDYFPFYSVFSKIIIILLFSIFPHDAMDITQYSQCISLPQSYLHQFHNLNRHRSIRITTLPITLLSTE